MSADPAIKKRALRWVGLLGFVLSASLQGANCGCCGLPYEAIYGPATAQSPLPLFCSPFILWVFHSPEGLTVLLEGSNHLVLPQRENLCSCSHRTLP